MGAFVVVVESPPNSLKRLMEEAKEKSDNQQEAFHEYEIVRIKSFA